MIVLRLIIALILVDNPKSKLYLQIYQVAYCNTISIDRNGGDQGSDAFAHRMSGTPDNPKPQTRKFQLIIGKRP